MSASGRARPLGTLGAARGARRGPGLLGVLLVARALLARRSSGHWSLALAVQGYALHLGEFGLRSVVTTEAARAGRRLPELLRRYLGLRLALGPWPWPWSRWLRRCLRPASAAAGRPRHAVHRPDRAAARLAGPGRRPATPRRLLLLVRPLAFLALVGLYRSDPAPTLLAACYLAAWALSALAVLHGTASHPHLHRGDLPTRAHLLRRGAALAMVTVTNQAQLSADLLVVGWALGAAAAGDYYLAGQVLVSACCSPTRPARSRWPACPPWRTGRSCSGGTLLAGTRHALVRVTRAVPRVALSGSP